MPFLLPDGVAAGSCEAAVANGAAKSFIIFADSWLRTCSGKPHLLDGPQRWVYDQLVDSRTGRQFLTGCVHQAFVQAIAKMLGEKRCQAVFGRSVASRHDVLHVDAPCVNDAGKAHSIGDLSMAQPSELLTQMAHRRLANLLAEILRRKDMYALVVMSSQTVSKSVVRELERTHDIIRLDALPVFLDAYPAFRDKLQTAGGGRLLSVLYDQKNGGTLVCLHTYQASYGYTPRKFPALVAENNRQRAAAAVVAATLLTGSAQGLDASGVFDLGRAAPGLLQGASSAVSEDAQYGSKGGLWRKIQDGDHEVNKRNMLVWIELMHYRCVAQGLILVAKDRKAAGIFLARRADSKEHPVTGVVYNKLAAEELEESRQRIACAVEEVNRTGSETVYGEDLGLLCGDVTRIGKARREAALAAQAVGRAKGLATAHHNLAVGLAKAGNFDALLDEAEAMPEGKRTGAHAQAVGLAKAQATAHHNFAVGLAKAGNFDALVDEAEAMPEGKRTGAHAQAVGLAKGLAKSLAKRVDRAAHNRREIDAAVAAAKDNGTFVELNPVGRAQYNVDDDGMRHGKWTDEESQLLRDGCKRFKGPGRWKRIAGMVGTRTLQQVYAKERIHRKQMAKAQTASATGPKKRKANDYNQHRSDSNGMGHGPWTNEEMQVFHNGLERFKDAKGQGKWKGIAGMVKTRTCLQVKSQAQRHYSNLKKSVAASTAVAKKRKTGARKKRQGFF